MSKYKRTTIGGLIIAFFSWIGQACSPFGKPVDKEISSSYFFSKSGNEIIYSQSGNWFELGKTKIKNVDTGSFAVLSDYLAKDKNSAFYQGKIINLPIDLATLKTGKGELMYFTFLDKNNVYSYNRDDEVVYVIKKADPITFERVDFFWSKDATHRFYQDKFIDVDYATFEVINETFGKDTNKVYMYAHLTGVNPIEADASSIKKFDDEYVYDNNNFYYYAYYVRQELIDTLNTMPYRNLEDVDVLNDTYIKIGNKIYEHGFLLENVDAQEFKLLDFLYAKDDKRAYYLGSLIKESEASTFESVGMEYSKDRNNVYYLDKIVVDANPATFRKSEGHYYYEDGVNKYNEGVLITDEE
ncbi:MAG: DKNYY domain-containing protein [Cyclobacteriaceae bacterium]|nr:DKNYY domain-containing protein [Cyclobacteriaceae bacterium]